MAKVKIITAETRDVFEERLNKELNGKSVNDFTIQFQATESYTVDSTVDEPERFYSAMILYKDDIKQSNVHNKNQIISDECIRTMQNY